MCPVPVHCVRSVRAVPAGSGAVRRPQAPKQGKRSIGATVGKQSSYRAAHRRIGQQLGQWQDVVRAVDATDSGEVAQLRYINRQLTVNARAQQTY